MRRLVLPLLVLAGLAAVTPVAGAQPPAPEPPEPPVLRGPASVRSPAPGAWS